MKKIILFLLVLTSCSKEYNNDFEIYFSEIDTISLKSEKIDLKTLFIQIPEMVFIDSLLIINDRDPDYTLKILNLRNKKIKKIGKKGRGPNEFLKPFSKVTVDNTSNKIHINDFDYCYTYSVDSLKIGYDNIQPLSKIKIELKNDAKYLMSTFCNGYIIGNTHSNPIVVYNIKTKNCIEKYSYDNGGALGNQVNFFSHPSKPKATYMQTNSEVIGIVSIDNDTMIVKNELSWWKEDNKLITQGGKTRAISKPSINRRRSFISATTSENYIYTLYSGRNPGKSKQTYDKARLSNMIYVFDWEGNPKKKYKLDQDITSIALDEKNNILYASAYNDGNPYIIKYKLL